MKNQLMKIAALLMVCGLAVSAPLALAEADPEGKGAGYHKGKWGGGPEKFYKELNLTSEQKEQLKAQREAKQENTKAVRDQLKVKMQALHETIAKPETTRTDVNGLVSEINTLKGQLFAQRIDGVFEMKQVLTPEQFTKMQAQHKERMEKMEKKRAGWMKHPKGPRPGKDMPPPPAIDEE